MIQTAILKIPSKTFSQGMTTANLGVPSYKKTLEQHSRYISRLKKCGLNTILLEPDNNFPDSTFVEDTAVVNKDIAIITRPGVKSRRGEENKISRILREIFHNIEFIKFPGTIEGGDVLKIENQYFIGLSHRTNDEGADQLIKILQSYDYSCTKVKMKKLLHLKSGISYIGDKTILTAGEFIDHPCFKEFSQIEVNENESYAANSLTINDFVLIHKNFKRTKEKIEEKGFNVLEIDVSEFQKMDGGLS